MDKMIFSVYNILYIICRDSQVFFVNMNIVPQIFGAGAMAALFLAYQQKKRRNLIICKLCADVCWAVHYFLLGAYGGMVPNFVGIFRELVFMRRDKSAWADKPYIPVVFILINWCIGFSTFRTPINIMPIAASTFVTISLWLKRPKLTKIISAPVSATFLVYDIFVGSWIGVINESAALVSIAAYFIREAGKKPGGEEDGH